MTVLIIGVLAAVWAAVAVLVVAVCASAAHGDAALLEPADEFAPAPLDRTARFATTGFSGPADAGSRLSA